MFVSRAINALFANIFRGSFYVVSVFKERPESLEAKIFGGVSYWYELIFDKGIRKKKFN